MASNRNDPGTEISLGTSVNGQTRHETTSPPSSWRIKEESEVDASRTCGEAVEIGLEDIDDPYSPRSLPVFRKWLIVAIICTATFCV